jgi:hypothetical protein
LRIKTCLLTLPKMAVNSEVSKRLVARALYGFSVSEGNVYLSDLVPNTIPA